MAVNPIDYDESKPLRIAHLTDIHIDSRPESEEGLIRCLKYVHSLDPKPDLIVNGGDAIRDALKDDPSTVSAHWEKFHQIFEAHCSIPVQHVIGNHDICAWETIAAGKNEVLKQLGLSSAYRTFNFGPWKFIILDSTRPTSAGKWYEAGLDENQFRWLKDQLVQTPENQPICVISHIPILSACAFLDGDNSLGGNWIVPGAWMHLDAAELTELFVDFPAVKLCLSGHIHLHEVLHYNGVKYLCNGAVSGNWWNGSYKQTKAGFGLIDLFPDGKVNQQYLSY